MKETFHLCDWHLVTPQMMQIRRIYPLISPFSGIRSFPLLSSQKIRTICIEIIHNMWQARTLTATGLDASISASTSGGSVEGTEKPGREKYRCGLTSFVPIWPMLPIVARFASVSAATSCGLFSLAIGILAGFDKDTEDSYAHSGWRFQISRSFPLSLSMDKYERRTTIYIRDPDNYITGESAEQIRYDTSVDYHYKQRAGGLTSRDYYQS